MIKISIHYYSDQTIKQLTVQGHALRAGKTINTACACVSNVMLGFLNWLKKSGKEKYVAEKRVKKGDIMLRFENQSRQWAAILELLISQLKLAHAYFSNEISWQVFK